MFLDYIKASSRHYKPAPGFIHDVLTLESEHLLADSSLGEEEAANRMKLWRDFQQFVRKFVWVKKLSEDCACKLRDVLVCAAHSCLYLRQFDLFMM